MFLASRNSACIHLVSSPESRCVIHVPAGAPPVNQSACEYRPLSLRLPGPAARSRVTRSTRGSGPRHPPRRPGSTWSAVVRDHRTPSHPPRHFLLRPRPHDQDPPAHHRLQRTAATPTWGPSSPTRSWTRSRRDRTSCLVGQNHGRPVRGQWTGPSIIWVTRAKRDGGRCG
jgi:hypothetical protein